MELYKLNEQVILKQTEDQYPVAALWEQLSNVANAKQGNSTNNEWYDRFNTKVEVAESVGVSFNFEKIWEYHAMEAHKAAYTLLRTDKQEAVRVSVRERFLSYALIKTSSSKHDKIKDNLLDDYTKGSDNYPQTRLQALMLMDHYSKTPTAITTLEGTAFAQSGKKQKKVGDKEKEPEAAKDPKDFDKEWWKDKECYRCSKKGHPASACSVKLLSNNDDKLIRSSKLASNAMAEIQKSMKAMGKAMNQLGETADFDDELFKEQLHAQLSVVSVKDARSEPWSGYSFATRALLLRNHLLLDNQSSVHIMCSPNFVDNIWEASQQMVLKSNGSKLLINKVADLEGFKRETWFSRNAMTNILSFSLVKSEYDITYDRDAFVIHQVAKGYSDMVFKPHKCGLQVYDPDDPRGHYSIMETVQNDVIEIPKQIMLGKGVHYKLCAMGFGRYCQIQKEDQPRNGMVARTQGAILLGPSGNAQGGNKFFYFDYCKVVL
jgi:hypothetical protein